MHQGYEVKQGGQQEDDHDDFVQPTGAKYLMPIPVRERI